MDIREVTSRVKTLELGSINKELSPWDREIFCALTKIVRYLEAHPLGGESPVSHCDPQYSPEYVRAKDFIKDKNVSLSSVYKVARLGPSDLSFRVGGKVFVHEVRMLEALKRLPRIESNIQKGFFYIDSKVQ